MSRLLESMDTLGRHSSIIFDNRLVAPAGRRVSSSLLSWLSANVDTAVRYSPDENAFIADADTAEAGHHAGLIQSVALVFLLGALVLPAMWLPVAETEPLVAIQAVGFALFGLVIAAAASKTYGATVEPEAG